MVSSIHDVPGQKMYFTWQRKRKQSKNCKDIISSLPDDILIHILSLLDLREAATTSVLSKRWRYVWANLSNLDFDGLSTLHGRGYSNRYESDACKYVHRVNQVVSSSLAPRIHKFRIRFLLGASYGYDIHTWVNFAMRKNVKELELNFSSCWGVGPKDPFYMDSFRCYAKYPSAHSLVSLSLSGLSISGYFLESVLFNFPNLERLTMKHSYFGQSKLNVVGDLLKLRHLEISYCYDYKEVEISAGNLISFVYFGRKQNVKFGYVPLLNEVSVSGSHSLHTIRSLHNSGFLPQLTNLKLRVVEIQDFIQSPIRFPQCGNLKQLDFRFCDGAYHSLLIFTNLIDACPVLHKFKLQVQGLESGHFGRIFIRNDALGPISDIKEASTKPEKTSQGAHGLLQATHGCALKPEATHGRTHDRAPKPCIFPDTHGCPCVGRTTVRPYNFRD